MTIKYKDINLNYEKYGDNKEVIVILPGWGETRNTFLDIINILKIDYTVYIIDYAHLIIHFLRELNIKKPNIIAHSFGGRIAILLNSIYNINFKNLILIDSAGIKPKMT